MIDIDWRSAAAYRCAESLSADGLAWEYLRRNDEYVRDLLAVDAGVIRLETFSRRWGLRFPLPSGFVGRRPSGLAAEAVSASHSAVACAR